jgi:hypothetical protein
MEITAITARELNGFALLCSFLRSVAAKELAASPLCRLTAIQIGRINENVPVERPFQG